MAIVNSGITPSNIIAKRQYEKKKNKRAGENAICCTVQVSMLIRQIACFDKI